MSEPSNLDPIENITVIGHRKKHDPNELRVVVNGKSYSGWTGVRVTRGVERMPGDFEVTVTEKFPGIADLIAINPGDACRVMIGDDPVITGFVDRYFVQITASQHQVTITGRGRCQDLVDCSAGVTPPGNSIGGQYAASTVPGLLSAIAAPFNITVNDNDWASAYFTKMPLFSVNLGETPFEIIDRVARYAGCLAYEGTDGNLIVATVGVTAAASGFSQGKNVQAITTARTMDERFSIYLGSFVSVDSFSQIEEAFDPQSPGSNFFQSKFVDAGVPRFRPKVIVSEQMQSGIAICSARAAWEGKRRYGKSQVATVLVDTWRDSAGVLWTPNTLAPVSLPAAKVVPKDLWVISEVTFTRSRESGTTALVTLMSPEAFDPEPSVLQGVDLQTYDELHPPGGGGARGY